MAEIPMAFNLRPPSPGAGATAISQMYAADRRQEASMFGSALDYKKGMEYIKADYFKSMLISRDKALERHQRWQTTMLGERNKEIDRQRTVHQFNLNQLNESMRNALNIKNDANVHHYEELIKAYVNSMGPYFKSSFRPWLAQNAMGSLEYKVYNFEKNNKRPRMPEDLTFDKDPYTFGQIVFGQNEYDRKRASIASNTPIKPEPDFLSLYDKHNKEVIYLSKDADGLPYYMSSQNMHMNDVIKRSGGTKDDLFNFHKNGGALYGEVHESYNHLTNRTERSQLITRPFAKEGKKHILNILPPTGKETFGDRPTVSPFEGYDPNVKALLHGMQLKFGPMMQLTSEELAEVDDNSPSMSVLRDIRGLLDKEKTFDEIGNILSGRFAPDLNIRLIEPKQFDKYTWYNPLDRIDPEHIRGKAKFKTEEHYKIGPSGKPTPLKYTGYKYPVGEHDWTMKEFWKGSQYIPGPEFGIVMFRGELTPFQKADGSIVHFFYNDKDGADIVTNANGVELGSFGEVTEHLLSGGMYRFEE